MSRHEIHIDCCIKGRAIKLLYRWGKQPQRKIPNTRISETTKVESFYKLEEDTYSIPGRILSPNEDEIIIKIGSK